MAAFLGIDPIAYMRLDALELRAMNVVLDHLAKMKADHERRATEFLAHEIANQVISRIQ